MRYLKHFVLKNYEIFTDQNLEKLCPWPQRFLSLALRGSARGKLVLCLGLFFGSFASNVVSSTPAQVVAMFH